ncbi:MAG: UDP-glucose/GDP-mannose dehydrogenase family protein [Flavobacteriales bacterium]|jgi:UDPglucose 6-dehydrogenase|nr:UDP-glucose/GDP-mannose dehydrogenase family protein [Flavobacteriales bacterium]
MNIGVIGSGYVGLVAAACFSEMGNTVICVDVDIEKINSLKKGKVPIYEPGLETLVVNNFSKNRLIFTTDIIDALRASEVIFIAVGTPMGDDGSADLKYVLKVAESIGKNMSHHIVVVDKSTVPIGTADKVRATIQNSLDLRKSSLTFDIVSNPEFLKEGAAIKDFMHPDRVVVGSNNKDSLNLMRNLYAPFIINSDRFISMDIRSAEMTKYAANAMLATKISFINEISNICERVGADVNEVRKGIGSDSRIGYKFIYPGCGYGGSCFPKDVKALINIAEKNDYTPNLISAVEKVNDDQKKVLFSKIVSQFGNSLNGKRFTVWGLSFKPETDDMREAPSITLIRSLLESGAEINAYDPQAINEAKLYLKDCNVNYFTNKYEALENSDAVILVTEWKEFRSPDFNRIHNLLRGNLFIDGRNQFDKSFMKSQGFNYLQIGVK